MNKRNGTMHLGIGAPSLLMIFVVLVMCILAVLSYLKANSFYEGTLRHLDITAQYYESEEQLLNIYYQLEQQNVDTQLRGYNLNYEKKGNEYVIFDDINEQTVLELKFSVSSQGFELLSLQSVSQEEIYGY